MRQYVNHRAIPAHVWARIKRLAISLIFCLKILVLVACSMVCILPAAAQTNVPSEKAHNKSPRHIETINDNWVFYKGSLASPFSDDDQVSWQKVTIPHSWNTQDILDDEDGYYRGDGWYKKKLTVPEVYTDQKVFLLFEGVNQVTSLVTIQHPTP